MLSLSMGQCIVGCILVVSQDFGHFVGRTKCFSVEGRVIYGVIVVLGNVVRCQMESTREAQD